MTVSSSPDREFVDRIPVWFVVLAILLGTLGMIYSATILTASDLRESQNSPSLRDSTDFNEPKLPILEKEMAVVKRQEIPSIAAEKTATDQETPAPQIQDKLTYQETPAPQTQDKLTYQETPAPQAQDKLTYQETPTPQTQDAKLDVLPSASTESGVQTGPAEMTSAAGQATETPDCPPLFTVHFPRGSTTPKTSDLAPKVTALRDWLKAHPEVRIFIEGHTCALGGEEVNLLISRQRAMMVRKLLKDAGVSGRQLLTRAHGEHMLLDGVPPHSQQHRRVAMNAEGFQDCLATAKNGQDI